MDNFDEFEFKPITEGLGFHKKTQKSKLDLSDTLLGKTLPQGPGKNREKPQENFRDRNTQFTKLNQPQKNEPRIDQPNEQGVYQPNFPSSKKNKSPNYQLKNTATFIEEPQVTSETQHTYSREKIAAALPSIFFDAIVVIGLTGLFLFATFLIAKVDPLAVIAMIPRDPMTTLGLIVLVFSVLQGYLLISRSFFAATLGEWAFEIEVGSKQDQNSALYPFRILIRSIVTAITGFVTLPILSLILGEDIAGRISGASLRRG